MDEKTAARKTLEFARRYRDHIQEEYSTMHISIEFYEFISGLSDEMATECIDALCRKVYC